ncbi:MAG: substrate-binding periplasmic protein [Pseudomonas sp.]
MRSLMAHIGMLAVLSLPLLSHTKAEATEHELRIGLIDFAPYSYHDENQQPAGLFINLLEQIANESGLQPRFRILPIARLVQGLQEGSIDVWPGIDGKTDLVDYVLLSPKVLGHISINLYYRSDTPAPIWPADVMGKDMIMLSGYDYWPSLLETINDPGNRIRVQRTHSHSGALGMLLRKRADYLMNYQAPMQQALQLRPDLHLQYVNLENIPLHMIISRRSRHGGELLQQRLDSSYERLLEQGTDLDLPDI